MNYKISYVRERRYDSLFTALTLNSLLPKQKRNSVILRPGPYNIANNIDFVTSRRAKKKL